MTNWIDANEHLPPVNKPVEVKTKNGITIAKYFGGKCWIGKGKQMMTTVTHWRSRESEVS